MISADGWRKRNSKETNKYREIKNMTKREKDKGEKDEKGKAKSKKRKRKKKRACGPRRKLSNNDPRAPPTIVEDGNETRGPAGPTNNSRRRE